MMKRVYISMISLALVGLILAIYMIPTEQDLARIILEEERYSEVQAFYEERFAEGDRSPEVINSLAEIYVHKGRIDKTIELVKAYAEAHPKDPRVLKLLASLYVSNHQYDEYAAVLKELKDVNPQGETLQDLAQWYRSEEELGLTPIVMSLVETEYARGVDYLDLAYIHYLDGDPSRAAELLEIRRFRFPQEVQIGDILFEVRVLLASRLGVVDDPALERKTAGILADFLRKKKEPVITHYAVHVVGEKYPTLMPYLLVAIKDELKRTSALEALALQQEWKQPSKKRGVLYRAINLYRNQSISPTLLDLLTEISLEGGYDLLLYDVIKNTPHELFHPQQIFSLAYDALSSQRPSFARGVQEALGKKYLTTHPLEEALLATGTREKGYTKKIDAILDDEALTQRERYYLLMVAAGAKNRESTLKIGKELFPYHSLDDEELIDVALAYIQVGEEQQLYDVISKNVDLIGEYESSAAIAMLDIALGRSASTAKWLQNQNDLSDDVLYSFYSAAQQKKEYPLSLYIAKRLIKDYPSPRAEAYYNLALVQIGKVRSGISHLTELYEAYPENNTILNAYFTALIRAARMQEMYQNKLVQAIEQRMRAYHIPTYLMRDFGYAYLDVLHDFNKSEQIFWQLAQRTPEQNQDIETLVHLWGAPLSPQRRRWLVNQARKATSEQMAGWLRVIGAAGADEEVVNLYEYYCTHDPQWEPSPADDFAYMDALGRLKCYGRMRGVVLQGLCKFKKVTDLKKLANYALAADYAEGRRLIWDRIVCEEPENPLAWQGLGQAALDQRDYCAAAGALLRFFSLYAEDPKPNLHLYRSMYEYGEVLENRNLPVEARQHYLAALCLIYASEEQTFAMLETEALLLFKLNSRKGAVGLMQELYELSSYNPDVAATFAGMLMDAGAIGGAEAVIREGNFE